MTERLPTKMGKMAIAVSRSNAEKVYALIEGDSNEDDRGLYVSLNAGKSWSHVTDEPRLVQRAWYYIELFVDPTNENTIYVLSAPALRSDDGGKTWTEVDGVHGDYHDMWINPDDPDNFILADDGGAVITFDKGKSWSSQVNMPTAQLYRINVDNRFPYCIYAGQQDNSSLAIASRELGSGGITTASWAPSAGGESAFLAFDPDNPRYVMGGSYHGTIEVLDTQAQAGTQVMAAPIQIAQAAQWLAETSITVSEIAYGAGFKSVPHFCGKFRERYGETPSGYRRRRRTGAADSADATEGQPTDADTSE